jgi:hypothetical protein
MNTFLTLPSKGVAKKLGIEVFSCSPLASWTRKTQLRIDPTLGLRIRLRYFSIAKRNARMSPLYRWIPISGKD